MKKTLFSLGFLLLTTAQGVASFKTPLYEFVAKQDCEIVLNPNIPTSFGVKDSPNHAIIEIQEKEKLAKAWEELTSKLAAKFKDTPTLRNYLLFMDPGFSKISSIERVLRFIARFDTQNLLSDIDNSNALVKQLLSTAAQMEQNILKTLPEKEVQGMNFVTAVALRFDQLQKRDSSEEHFDLVNESTTQDSPYINSFLTFGAGTEIASDWNGIKNVGEWIQTPKGFQTIITGGARTLYQGRDYTDYPGAYVVYYLGEFNGISKADELLRFPRGLRPTFHRAPNDKESGYPARALLFVSIFATGVKLGE